MIFARNMSMKKRLCYCFISVMVIVSYLCLGALVFTAIERPQQLENETPEIKTLERILDNLDKMRDSCNSSDSSGDMEQSFFDLLNETKELTNELLRTERESFLLWDFLTGIHFCMTAVTTIGYGYIAPETQLGRGICIFYTIIGIPLNIFVLANLGFFVAQVVSKLYSFIEKCFSCGGNSPEIHDVDNLGDLHDDEEIHTDHPDGVGECNPNAPITLTNTAIRYNNNNAYTPDDDTAVQNMTVDMQERNKMADEGEKATARNDVGKQSQEQNTETKEKAIEENIKKETRAKKLQWEARRQAPRPKRQSTIIPLWFLCLILLIFCALSSTIIFYQRKGTPSWSYLDCVYFVFVTFTTVGFGDLKYGVSNFHDVDGTFTWVKIVYIYILMELGLVVMAATITICSERWKENAKNAKNKLKRNRIVQTIARQRRRRQYPTTT